MPKKTPRYIVSGFDTSPKSTSGSADRENTYELLRGNVITVGAERFGCTENTTNHSQSIMNYDDRIRKDLHVGAKDLRETAQKHRDTCSGWLRLLRESDMHKEASYSYTATKGICKAPSCAVGSPMSAGRKIGMQSFVPATVSVTVSLGAKPSKAEGECPCVHRLDTVALLHTCFPCLQTCQSYVTILPTHSRWLKAC